MTSWRMSTAEGSTSAGSCWKEDGMESPGPLDAIKLVVQHRLVTATYLPPERAERAEVLCGGDWYVMFRRY